LHEDRPEALPAAGISGEAESLRWQRGRGGQPEEGREEGDDVYKREESPKEGKTRRKEEALFRPVSRQECPSPSQVRVASPEFQAVLRAEPPRARGALRQRPPTAVGGRKKRVDRFTKLYYYHIWTYNPRFYSSGEG